MAENKLLYDKLTKAGIIKKFLNKKKIKSKIATVIVYESIGGIEIFDGVYSLMKGHIDKLGNYSVIDYKGKFVFLDNPIPTDYIPCKDKKMIKLLQVVKYAEDDFRIKNKVNEQCYFKRTVPQTKQVEKEHEGEKYIDTEEVKDEDTSETLYEEREYYIENASVVTQEGRDAIRTGNEYKLKMKDFMATKEGFWNKNAVTIIGMTFMVLMLIAIISLGGKYLERLGEMNSAHVEENKAQRAWYQEGFVDQLSTQVAQKQKTMETPPS